MSTLTTIFLIIAAIAVIFGICDITGITTNTHIAWMAFFVGLVSAAIFSLLERKA